MLVQMTKREFGNAKHQYIALSEIEMALRFATPCLCVRGECSLSWNIFTCVLAGEYLDVSAVRLFSV